MKKIILFILLLNLALTIIPKMKSTFFQIEKYIFEQKNKGSYNIAAFAF